MISALSSNKSLGAYRESITSQYGEDGVFKHIFEIIGVENRWCVEFGAGSHNNNTWHLVNDKDWSAVLIEAHPVYYKRLKKNYAKNKKIICLPHFVGFEGKNTLDAILKKTDIPQSFDLLIIDIDGNDYHVWDAVRVYNPRVVMVEYNGNIPIGKEFVQPRSGRIWGGASLSSLVSLGKKKGYELVYAHISNAMFVRKDLYLHFNMKNNSPEHIVEPFWPKRNFFKLYDGSVVLYGGERKSLLAYKKKIVGSSVWFLDEKGLHPVTFSYDRKIFRFFKNILKNKFTYSFIYPVAERFYSGIWKKKKAQLEK